MYLCTDFVQNFCFCQGDALDGSWVSKVIGAGHYAPVQDVAWEHAGRYLVSVSKDQTSRLWYTCTHTHTRTHTHTHTHNAGRYLVSVSKDQTSRLWYICTHIHTHTHKQGTMDTRGPGSAAHPHGPPSPRTAPGACGGGFDLRGLD